MIQAGLTGETWCPLRLQNQPQLPKAWTKALQAPAMQTIVAVCPRVKNPGHTQALVHLQEPGFKGGPKTESTELCTRCCCGQSPDPSPMSI